MKRWILLILAIGNLCLVKAQELKRMEYFIDKDPGFGQGTPLQVSPSSSLEQDYIIPLNVQPGMHQLFVRAQDNRGYWSITTSRIFYVNPVPAKNKEIVALEYFIDKDPGFGNATPINVTQQENITLDFTANLSAQNISHGYHQLFIRALDTNGKWSATNRRIFYLKSGSNRLAKIVRLEYFLETEDYISDTYTYPIEEPSTSVSLDFQANLGDLPKTDVIYNMSLYAVNEDGIRSFIERREIKVCSDEPAKANFTYQVTDGQVNLQNTSTNASTFEWLWGEDESATTTNHTLTFENPGLYEVCLVASNFCNNDTICQYVAVPGIGSIYPTVGTIQQQDATVTIVGFGLDSIPEIKLVSPDNMPLLPKQIIRADSVSIRAIFDFSGAKPTNYTLQVINNNGQDTLTATQNFSLLEKGNIPFDEWVPFELASGETFNGEVLVPEADELFVFVKKADRIGYSGTWRGNVSLNLGDEELATENKAEDFDLQLKDPISSVYSVEITNDRNSSITGEVKVSYAPDWLKLNEWQKGEILRPYGYDWKYFGIGDNADTLFFQTEGYGLWSTIEVFHQSLEEPENQWTFSNMGAGYAIQGNIANPPTGRYYVRYKDSAVLRNTENGAQDREYLIYVGIKSSPEIIKDFSISSISTNSVGQGLATISLEGTGFSEGDTIILERDGFSDVYILPNEISSDGRIISFQYDFSDIEAGTWDLKIQNNERSIYLKDKFNIEENGNADLWVEIFGRDKIRVGRKQKLVVKYGNNGNVDAKEIILFLEIPKNIIDTIGLPVAYYEEYNGQVIYRNLNYIFIPKIPANFSSSFEITLQSNEVEPIKFKAGYLNYSLENNDNSKLASSRIKEDEISPKINCEEKPKYGDLVFSYFMTKKIEAFKHVGILGYKKDPDGTVRDYVFEVYKDGHVYARRWEFTEKEINDYKKDLENKELGKISEEYFKNTWIKLGVDVNDDAYEKGLKNYKEKNGKDFYIGNGRLGASPDEKLLNNLNDRLINDYKEYNQNTGVKVFDYSLLADYFSSEGREDGHCGSFVFDNAVHSEFLDLIDIDNPRNHPYLMKEKLVENGLFCNEQGSEENEKNGPVLIAPYPEDSIFDQYDKNVDSIKINETQKEVESVSSTTPEDKYGPTGFDQNSAVASQNRKRFVPKGQLFEYKIDYWNKEDATAPAAEVFIRDTLDTDFDISTFNFTEIGFLRWKLPLEGGQYFNVTVDMRPDKNLLVNVEGTLDLETREIYWVHRSLDPETMEFPEDPTAGYLPPIDSAGYNIGWVNYTIEPKDSLGHNTVFTNQAHVNFDGVGPWGKAPPYGPYTNTIDLVAPQSQVKPLAVRVAPEFEVQWTGTDDGGGIGTYDIYVSEDGGEFTIWLNDIADTLALFSGEAGKTYAFYSVATDHTRNQEEKSDTIEASAYVVPLPGEVTLISPIESAQDENGDIKFTWEPAYEADSYLLQVASDSLFASSLLEQEVADTTTLVADLEAEQTYYWRAKALNVSGESDWSDTLAFTISRVTGIEEERLASSVKLYPNPSSGILSISAEFSSITDHVQAGLYTIHGSKLQQKPLTRKGTEYYGEFDLSKLSDGIYIVVLTGENFSVRKKIQKTSR